MHTHAHTHMHTHAHVMHTVCESYSVEPTGKEDFDRMSTCSARSCDVCVHGHSEAAMKCLQYQLLTQNTVSRKVEPDIA